MNRPLLIVVCGPTATGKSDLAVFLAERLNGEVISADSRQVYRGLDIGAGKITSEEMRGIPHHLLDVTDPSESFSAERFRVLATEALAGISTRGKTPLVCGGTGFYIDALLAGTTMPSVPPDEKLRTELAHETPEALLARLEKLDPARAAVIAANPSDRKNPRRLIRAIEVAAVGKKQGPSAGEPFPYYRIVKVGLTMPIAELEKKIRTRLDKRLKAGLIEEVARLHATKPDGFGLTWERLDGFGLEYRFVSRYLRDLPDISPAEQPKALAAMAEKLAVAIRQYAKRQMTWFKRDESIAWFDPNDVSTRDAILEEIRLRI